MKHLGLCATVLASLAAAAGTAFAQTAPAAPPAVAPAPLDPVLLPSDIPPPSVERMLQPPRARVPGQVPGMSPPDSTPALGMELSIELARAAIAACSVQGLRVGAAVADASGNLRVGLTGDTVAPGKIFAASRKNVAVIAFGMATSEIQAKLRIDTAARALVKPNMMLFPGGVPVIVHGKIIGAIAVSGGTGEQDEACARAGLASIQAKLK